MRPWPRGKRPEMPRTYLKVLDSFTKALDSFTKVPISKKSRGIDKHKLQPFPYSIKIIELNPPLFVSLSLYVSMLKQAYLWCISLKHNYVFCLCVHIQSVSYLHLDTCASFSQNWENSPLFGYIPKKYMHWQICYKSDNMKKKFMAGDGINEFGTQKFSWK